MHEWSPSDDPGGIPTSSSTCAAEQLARSCSRIVVTATQYTLCSTRIVTLIYRSSNAHKSALCMHGLAKGGKFILRRQEYTVSFPGRQIIHSWNQDNPAASVARCLTVWRKSVPQKVPVCTLYKLSGQADACMLMLTVMNRHFCSPKWLDGGRVWPQVYAYNTLNHR